MIFRKEIMIVLVDFVTFEDFESDYGVFAKPTLLGGLYCLPLGWEDELKIRNINFVITEVIWQEEEI